MFLNYFKSFFQNVQEIFLSHISNVERRNDEVVECMHFGICAAEVQSPRPEELFFRLFSFMQPQGYFQSTHLILKIFVLKK